MWGFQRGSQLLASALRIPRAPQVQITSKPPEHPVSAAEQTIALSVMSACFLLPTAWILAHIQHYKSRPE